MRPLTDRVDLLISVSTDDLTNSSLGQLAAGLGQLIYLNLRLLLMLANLVFLAGALLLSLEGLVRGLRVPALPSPAVSALWCSFCLVCAGLLLRFRFRGLVL